MIILNVTCIILDYRLDNEQPYRIKETSARLYQTLGNNNKWCPMMDIFIFEDSWVNFIFVVSVRACVSACEPQEKHMLFYTLIIYGKIKLCRFRKVTITICKVITSLPDPMLLIIPVRNMWYNHGLSIVCVIDFIIITLVIYMYRYFPEMTKILSNNSLTMYFEKMGGKLYIFPFFFTINFYISK